MCDCGILFWIIFWVFVLCLGIYVFYLDSVGFGLILVKYLLIRGLVFFVLILLFSISIVLFGL